MMMMMMIGGSHGLPTRKRIRGDGFGNGLAPVLAGYIYIKYKQINN